MKLLKLFVSAAALSLAIAGCAMIPVVPDAPGVATVPGAAPALSLKIDWGRRVQAVASDVARANISLTVADRTYVTQASASIAPAPLASPSVAPVASPSPNVDAPKPLPSDTPFLDTVDLSRATGMELVAGDARVHVEAYDKNGRMIGTGDAVVPLLVGRRSYVQVQVKLESTGHSDFMPLTPLGPQPTPSPAPTWVPSPAPTPSGEATSSASPAP